MEVWGGGTSPFLDGSVVHIPESLLGKSRLLLHYFCAKNEETTMEGKRKMRTMLFPRYLHIDANRLLRDICGGARTQLLWNLGLVSFLF